MCIKSITDPHICISKSETCLVHYIHTLLKQKHSKWKRKIQEYKIKKYTKLYLKNFFLRPPLTLSPHLCWPWRGRLRTSATSRCPNTKTRREKCRPFMPNSQCRRYILKLLLKNRQLLLIMKLHTVVKMNKHCRRYSWLSINV